MLEALQNWETLIRPSIIFGAAILAGLAGQTIVFFVLRRLFRRADSTLGVLFVKHGRGPVRLLLPLLLIRLVLPLAAVPEQMHLFLSQALSLLLIVSVAWLLIRGVTIIGDFVLGKYETDVADNLRARQMHTQVRILRKVIIVIVAILGFGLALMTFDKVRQLGTSILASAGIIGIIVGIAAQRSIATLLAGIQIALTQPIRLDDVVIVEGEWGRIEEITLTYLVVRIWDKRRLILPVTYFLEKPFQNWTRVSADLLGTVFVYVDYGVSLDAVRKKLQRIAESSDHWDGKLCKLQVTNATEKSMELRALLSARDSSAAWELRCEIREKLIGYIQNTYPESLPRVRAEVSHMPETEGKEDKNGNEQSSAK
jgi:small-conductance mechanosensitive channel